MKVGIVGASGYAGGELLRLLLGHEKFEVSVICAGSNAGELITSVHPHLNAYIGKKFSALDFDSLNECELVFLALPHGESKKIVANLKSTLKIVDLGADFRLDKEENWNKYYDAEYAGFRPYGLPELVDKGIYSENNFISNPGCYATAIALGVAPLLNNSEVDSSDIVVVAASGTTGAGRSAKVNLSASEVVNNLASYKFGGVHQHTPEIEQLLNRLSGSKVTISFTPVLAPMPRGILATISCKVIGNLNSIGLRNLFLTKYAKTKFIKVLDEGLLPNTSALTGSNYVHIQTAIDEHAQRVVVSVALDNLGKGAAGQAIQNANLLFGYPEELGLSQSGVK